MLVTLYEPIFVITLPLWGYLCERFTYLSHFGIIFHLGHMILMHLCLLLPTLSYG